MLNITKNSINKYVQPESYTVFEKLNERNISKWPIYVAIFLGTISFLALFLPWTQNINAKGYVTTLKPNQRPQAIQSVISGKLEDWYVQEGDYVEAGDTIVFLSEVKSEYLDPNLIERTNEQVLAKESSVGAYGSKAQSLQMQYNAMVEARKLKLQQTRNKITQAQLKLKNDSLDLIAFKTDAQIAQNQLTRSQELYDKGLKPLTDLEAKRLKYQETQAKVNSQRNKLDTRRQEIANLRIELPAIESEYADKLAKTQSELFSARSAQLDARASTSKLKNQLSNYEQRQNLYHVVAPQSGYITKAIKKGVGEVIKEGTDIVTIVPGEYDLAMEIYIKPRDLPLVQVGTNVNLLFDGWPAVVFSGWPNQSFGTFSGEVVAIDRDISENGLYRMLIAPNDPEKLWPEPIRVGSGGKAFILLNEVPIWYELWRQLNGFPADFYEEKDASDPLKRKAPLKQVK
ncbi:MAG: HlyD family secretion protein [Saprospiraceae bacterium]|nr:HlyD family secretion protein [Saprospiraceae bacterium]